MSDREELEMFVDGCITPIYEPDLQGSNDKNE